MIEFDLRRATAVRYDSRDLLKTYGAIATLIKRLLSYRKITLLFLRVIDLILIVQWNELGLL